jgi:putative sugar O-methyltransferase
MKIKSKIKHFIPPLFLKAYIRIRQNRDYPPISRKFLGEFQDEIDPMLAKQIGDYLTSEDFDFTSKYWRFLMRKNLSSLHASGVERYAKTVARNYFTWVDFNDEEVSNLTSNIISTNAIDIYKFHEGFYIAESIKHNILISLLFNYCSNNHLLDDLFSLGNEGYLFGGHPFHLVQGQIITLDSLNSVIESSTIRDYVDSKSIICEIGAGSGRTAEAIIRLNPGIHYIIADLPPASFIAMNRLQLAFPESKIIYINSKDDFLKAFQNLDSWQIIFCLPSLLKEAPDKIIDICIAVDCLHEMSNKMRRYISNIVDRKCRFFYLKIWEETTIPIDNITLSANSLSDYFVDPKWKRVFDKSAVFPGNFRELIFYTQDA